MADSLQYRFLREDDLPRIHETFVTAFSGYTVPVERALDDTVHTLARRGVHYRLSVGAFAGDDMVGVMATGFGPYQGIPTAYDIFTGVIPGYRGRGIAGGMLDFAAPSLARLGAERFVLEVIQTNVPAVTAYERAGFESVRELVCMLLPRDAMCAETLADGVTVEVMESPDWEHLRKFWDWEPSWQNAIESVERSAAEITVLGAMRGRECVGYAVLELPSNDVAQIAVAPSHRRTGVARSLCGAVARRAHPGSRTLRFMNIEGAAEADLAFFYSLGAEELVRQFEMHRLI